MASTRFDCPSSQVLYMFLSKAEENIAFRSSFLVDPEGVIVSMEKCDIPVK